MDWLNYHHLYYFWTVAKEKSFTRAAEKLRIAQSAVSLQVSQLETALDRKLIERSTSKKLKLTEEGQIVYQQAEEIFRQGQDLVASIKAGSRLTAVRVGAMGSLSKNLQIQMLKPILKDSGIELTVDVGDSASLLTKLMNFSIDLILCDDPYSNSETERLIQKEIASEPICFVGQRRVSRSFESRLQAGVYVPSKSNPITADIEAYLKKYNQASAIRGYIDDIALLRLLALETDSVVAIPRIGVERELKNKTLKVLHELTGVQQRFFLVLRQNGLRSQNILQLLT